MRTEDKLLTALARCQAMLRAEAEARKLPDLAETEGNKLVEQAEERRRQLINEAEMAIDAARESVNKADDELYRVIKAAGWADKDIFNPATGEIVRLDTATDELVLLKRERDMIVLTPGNGSKKLPA